MSSDAVVIWGELLWDRFGDGDRLGGAPANVAWHLGQAGGWARLVTRVGDDPDGHRAIEQLSEVVDTSLVQLDFERATGEVTIELVDGEPQYKLHAGRAWERIECTLAVRGALAEAGVMIYGTLAQRTPEGLAAWRQAAAAASSTCLRVCDLNLRKTDRYVDAVREAIAAADLVKINDRELAALREWFGWDDPVAYLRERRDAPSLDRAPRVVALTHGADGSTLFGEGAPVRIPAVPARGGGDFVGCGDAYLAILVYGMTAGWDLETSGLAAARWASAVAEHRGATPWFSDDRILELLGEA